MEVVRQIFTLPNVISLLRFPLAFLFLQENVALRLLALALAGLSDIADGHIARKYNMRSQLGTILDPIMDKFFVIFILAILIGEQKMALWQAASMLSRDIAVFLFGCYLALSSQLKTYQCQAIWCGKAMTFFQLIALASIICGVMIPAYFYWGFIVIGICAFFELLVTFTKKAKG